MEKSEPKESFAEYIGYLLEYGLPWSLAYLTALLTFFGSWIYCMGEYGYLWGLGLGWLPSAILAGILATLVRWGLWFVVFAAAAYFLGVFDKFI